MIALIDAKIARIKEIIMPYNAKLIPPIPRTVELFSCANNSLSRLSIFFSIERNSIVVFCEISACAYSIPTATTTKKKERIDAIVDIAKQEYDHNLDYTKIIQRLEKEMTINWALSPASKKEYLRTIRTTFEDTYQIRLVPEKGFIADEIDDNIVKA